MELVYRQVGSRGFPAVDEVKGKLALPIENKDRRNAGHIGELFRHGIIAFDYRIPRRMTLEKPVEPGTITGKTIQILKIIDRDNPQTVFVIGGLGGAQMMKFGIAGRTPAGEKRNQDNLSVKTCFRHLAAIKVRQFFKHLPQFRR